MNCPKCNSSNTNPHGRFVHCNDCGRYTQIEGKKASTFTEKRETNTAVFDGSVPRIMSDEHLLDFLNIDRETWRITKVVYGKSEGYRKDRRVDWKIQNGKTESGEVHDSGKLLIEPLFSVRVYLERKAEEIATRNEVEELRAAAKGYAPKYKKIKYPKRKSGYLYEIAMPDLQLGRLVQEDEAGLASSPDLYIKKAETAINKLLAIPFPIERILFPIGNDFFNSNTAEMKTAHGTPQQDDVRWQRTYKLAKTMIIGAIESMTQIAPVDVITVKGNHDEERIFYFGDTLESWFHRNPNVTVDNAPKKRKYYSYGNVLLGFTHGYFEKDVKLDSIMAYEVPDKWSASRFREWHLGDKHHKKDTIVKADESNGIMVRILRSLAPPSVWEYDKGFVNSIKAAEGFLWHKNDGLFAQFTATADEVK